MDLYFTALKLKDEFDINTILVLTEYFLFDNFLSFMFCTLLGIAIKLRLNFIVQNLVL